MISFYAKLFFVFHCFCFLLTPEKAAAQNVEDRLEACLIEIGRKSKSVFPYEIYFKNDFIGNPQFRYEYRGSIHAEHQIVKLLPEDRIQNFNDIESMKADIEHCVILISNEQYWAELSRSEQVRGFGLDSLYRVEEKKFLFGGTLVYNFTFLPGTPFNLLLTNGEYSIDISEEGEAIFRWRGERFWSYPEQDGVFVFEATFDLKRARCLRRVFYNVSDPARSTKHVFNYENDRELIPSQVVWESIDQGNVYRHVADIVEFDHLLSDKNNQCYLSFYGIEEPPFYQTGKKWTRFRSATYAGIIMIVLCVLFYLYAKHKSVK